MGELSDRKAKYVKPSLIFVESPTVARITFLKNMGKGGGLNIRIFYCGKPPIIRGQ